MMVWCFKHVAFCVKLNLFSSKCKILALLYIQIDKLTILDRSYECQVMQVTRKVNPYILKDLLPTRDIKLILPRTPGLSNHKSYSASWSCCQSCKAIYQITSSQRLMASRILPFKTPGKTKRVLCVCTSFVIYTGTFSV